MKTKNHEDDEISNENSVFESENIVIGINENNNNDETNSSSTDQNTEVDEELELPNINFTPQKTKEQKKTTTYQTWC